MSLEVSTCKHDVRLSKRCCLSWCRVGYPVINKNHFERCRCRRTDRQSTGERKVRGIDSVVWSDKYRSSEIRCWNAQNVTRNQTKHNESIWMTGNMVVMTGHGIESRIMKGTWYIKWEYDRQSSPLSTVSHSGECERIVQCIAYNHALPTYICHNPQPGWLVSPYTAGCTVGILQQSSCSKTVSLRETDQRTTLSCWELHCTSAICCCRQVHHRHNIGRRSDTLQSVIYTQHIQLDGWTNGHFCTQASQACRWFKYLTL